MDRVPGRSVGGLQSVRVGVGSRRAALLLLALSGASGLAPAAPAQCYRVTDTIPVSGGPGVSWVPTRMNRSAHFCGYRNAFGTKTAFVWRGSGIEWIPMPPEATGIAAAYGISEDGHICGEALALHPPSGDVGGVGFVLESDVMSLVYPPLDETGTPEGTMGLVSVNDAGVAVGWWQDATLHQHACVYKDGELTVISDLMSGVDSRFADVNASGLAVGWTEAIDEWPLAFAYDTNTGVVTELPQVDGFLTRAVAVADTGDIVAEWWPNNNGGQARVAIWDETDGWIKVDPPRDTSRFDARSCTDDRQVVGSVFSPLLDPAIWREGTNVRIDELQVGDETMPTGASAAGRDGSFVGKRNNNIIVVRPIGPPKGDLTHDCHIGFGDLLRILSIWGTEDPEADLDQSGAVDAGDFFVLFDLWD